MNGLGKLIGAFAGYLALGFWGIPLGIIVGHFFDLGLRGAVPGVSAAAQIRDVYFNSVFSVMGHVCKADGHISEREIRTAEQVMTQLRLSPAQRTRAIHQFNRGKEAGFNLAAEVGTLRRLCLFQPNLLRMFLEIQMQAVMADGGIEPGKRQLLLRIASMLGLSPNDLARLEALLGGSTGRHRTHAETSKPDHLVAAYRLLDVQAAAGESEIKKAYRRLMSQHHPDKLAAKGLPPEMAKMATQKTQEIRAAYELICEVRGFG